jgi:pimeloyl-ACP methyl ester carboxylesterase
VIPSAIIADRLHRNGHSEFFVTGTLKNWSVVDDLHKIKVPTLVLNGAYDEAQDECVEPFIKLIPDVKWVRFEESSHFPQWEERELYVKTVGDWLTAT